MYAIYKYVYAVYAALTDAALMDPHGASNDTELEKLKKRLQFVMYCIDAALTIDAARSCIDAALTDAALTMQRSLCSAHGSPRLRRRLMRSRPS
jgi:hypothetical protein